MDCGVTCPHLAGQRCDAGLGVNQSVRGPITTSSVTVSPVVGRSKAGALVSADTLAPRASRADRAAPSPAATGAGPTRASVSVEALPSTGATAKPPRTAR